MSHLVITGVTGAGSPNRLEINDLVKNQKFFSLYIQALQAMSDQSQGNTQSFFQISGIHGLPYVVWDSATSDASFDPNNQWGGYCTHGSVLFPTWHRPYVMLYEQILQQLARQIAATYTVDTEDWKQAANNLRQPYWDWAKNAIPPDEVIALEQVTIIGKDGKRVEVDNPLYHYAFHPIDASFPDPFSSWPTTLRQPTSTDLDATDDVATLKSILASAQMNITSSTYNLLTRVNTWQAFSNHTPGDGGSSSNSLEAIHDSIHVDVGGPGHMSDPSVAAFDPIFFLHHANVDRMLSLWSALNPDVWVSKGDSEDGTFTLAPGIQIDATTALTPFWNSQSTFWASTVVQDISQLGYTYPEFNGLDMGNTDAVRSAIGNIVNQLYGISVFGRSSAAVSSVPRSLTSIPVLVSTAKQVPKALPSKNPAPQQHVSLTPNIDHHSKSHLNFVVQPSSAHPSAHPSPAHPVVDDQSIGPPDHGLWDWTARIEFKKYEVGSSFSVLIFLGQVPDNPREWRTSHNFVGALHSFVNSAAASCSNCSNQQDMVVEGFVHLNHAIAQHSGLGSFEPDVIEPYLTEALRWRVLKSNGTPVELESLEVVVIATPLSYPPSAMFPVPGRAHRHHRITHGRSGGSRHP